MVTSKVLVSGVHIPLSKKSFRGRSRDVIDSIVGDVVIRNERASRPIPAPPAPAPVSAPTPAFPTCSVSSIGAHHWLLDSPGGSVSHGVCKYCRAERDFSNSFPEPSAVDRVRYQIARQTIQRELQLIEFGMMERE